MPLINKKITETTELTTAPAADDLIAIVDVSDTTDAASGTTKKQQWLNTIKHLFGSRFAADAGSTDTYAATLVPAPVAYITGEHYRFKANTANTGACTINFNGLGAKTIKKVAGGITTDLADNDIRAGQWVDLVYDGTNMQMQSLLGNAPAGGSGGIGDVVGPASSVDAEFALFDSTSGKLIKRATGTGFVKATSGVYSTDANPTAGLPFELVVACSDLTTALTTGTAKNTFPWPRSVTLSSVHAFLVTPQTSGSIFTVDVNEAGVSILSTKITIDNTETDSTTAATAPVLSDTGLAAMAKITVDIDQVGDGTAKGLYLVFVGVYA